MRLTSSAESHPTCVHPAKYCAAKTIGSQFLKLCPSEKQVKKFAGFGEEDS